MSKVLWAMHLMGPDDIYPAPSKAEALEVANRINYEFRDKEIKPYAVVIPWDGCEGVHFVQSNTFNKEWISDE